MGKHLGEKILQQLLSTLSIYRAHYSRHTRRWLRWSACIARPPMPTDCYVMILTTHGLKHMFFSRN